MTPRELPAAAVSTSASQMSTRLALIGLLAVASCAFGQVKKPMALPEMGRAKEDQRLQVRISIDFQKATVQQDGEHRGGP